eukprot:354060-Chlamydomonas_euryale.AAC.3
MRHPIQPHSSLDQSISVWQPRCRCKSGESQMRWQVGGGGILSDDQDKSAACCRCSGCSSRRGGLVTATQG